MAEYHSISCDDRQMRNNCNEQCYSTWKLQWTLVFPNPSNARYNWAKAEHDTFKAGLWPFVSGQAGTLSALENTVLHVRNLYLIQWQTSQLANTISKFCRTRGLHRISPLMWESSKVTRLLIGDGGSWLGHHWIWTKLCHSVPSYLSATSE